MTTVARAGRPGIWAFLGWAAVGAGLCLALATVLSIGFFVLLITAAGMVALIRWHGSRNGSVAGLLSGFGLVPAYIAYLNRGGPGTVCGPIARGQECATEWSPWPFLVVSVLLITAGLAVFARLRSKATG